MKRLIFTILFMLTMFVSFAQNNIRFKATSFAYANINTNTGRYTWSDWEPSSVLIVFDLTEDIIYIYSDSPQRYDIITQGQEYTDESGGKQVKYKVIDQDNDRGTLRLRIERNGNSQLYIDFNNVAWCYNVKRI